MYRKITGVVLGFQIEERVLSANKSEITVEHHFNGDFFEIEITMNQVKTIKPSFTYFFRFFTRA